MRTDGGEVASRVAGLAAAVAGLAEAEPAQLPARAQLDLLRGLWPLLCRLDAQVTRVVGAVNAQGSAAQDGAVSTVARLRSWLHAGNAAPRVQVATALTDLPEVAAAFARGDISFTHAHIAAKTAGDLDPAILAAGVDKTFGGTVSVSGMLAPDSGELLLQTLGAFMRPVNPDDLQPATTRRAEALTDICRAAAAQAPEAGGTRPQVTVTIDWDTLRGQTTHLFSHNGAWTGARAGSGTSLSPETARRLACDAGVVPMVLGSASQPLDVGRTQRLVTPAIRRALVARDGRCRFPGCDRPAAWCDAHHLKHWVHGGETSLPNMILTCRRHHVMVHEHGWRIHLDHHTGTVTAHDPSGRRLGTVSHPRAHSP